LEALAQMGLVDFSSSQKPRESFQTDVAAPCEMVLSAEDRGARSRIDRIYIID
jgi:hypothetical protein